MLYLLITVKSRFAKILTVITELLLRKIMVIKKKLVLLINNYSLK